MASPSSNDRWPSRLASVRDGDRAGERGSSGPTIVLVDEGNTHHIGQSRVWVDLARRLAARDSGYSGSTSAATGTAEPGPASPPMWPGPPKRATTSGRRKRRSHPTTPTDVVLIGFCSGAYQIAEGSLTHPTRGVCIINPSFSFVPARGGWLVASSGPPVDPALVREPGRPRPAAGPRADSDPRSRDAGERPRHRDLAGGGGQSPPSRSPSRSGGWSIGCRLENIGVATLERIVDAQVDTLLVCGPDDLLPVSLGSGRPGAPPGAERSFPASSSWTTSITRRGRSISASG